MYNSVYFIDSDIGRVVLKVAPDPNIPCMTSEINMLAAEVDALMENGFANYDRPDPDFLSGYGKTEFTQNELIRCSLYRLSLYLGMSVGHVYRNGANTQPEWMLEAFRDELLWLGTK